MTAGYLHLRRADLKQEIKKTANKSLRVAHLFLDFVRFWGQFDFEKHGLAFNPPRIVEKTAGLAVGLYTRTF